MPRPPQPAAAPIDLLARLATSVLWIRPSLEIQWANAEGEALLERIDAMRPLKLPRLARSVGCAGSALSAAEAEAVRRFLGPPAQRPRRDRVRVAGEPFEVGVAPIHGSRGEWLGWAVDAAPAAKGAAREIGIESAAAKVDRLVERTFEAAQELDRLLHGATAPGGIL